MDRRSSRGFPGNSAGRADDKDVQRRASNMAIARGRGTRRRRLGISFGVLVLTCAGLALPAGTLSEEAPQVPGQEDFLDPRVQAQIARELAEAEAAEPSAAEAEASETAYADLSDSHALALAREEFGEVVEEPLYSELELEAGQEIDSYIGRYEAVIDTEGSGQNVLVQSTLPLRTRNDVGRLRPLDMELEQAATGYEPENPLVATEVPQELSDGVEVGPDGLSVEPAALEPGVDGVLVEEKVFYANSDTDSDLIAAPLPTGVELFFQLRSAESAEEQALTLDLPAGAKLVAVELGAEVKSGEETLATISPPAAFDAAGQQVPARYRIDGSELEVVVSHHSGNYLYPILVDPVIEAYDWAAASTPGAPGTGASLDQWYWTAGSGSSFLANGFWLGLWNQSFANTYYQHGAWSEWVISSAGQSYIERIDYLNVYHTPRTASACTLLGIWNTAGWQTGRSQNPGTGATVASPETFCGATSAANRWLWVGNQHLPDGPAGDPEGTDGNMAVFAMTMAGAGQRTQSADNLLKGARIYRYDRNNPRFISAAPASSGWTDDGGANHNLTVEATDDGLGLKSIALSGPGIDAASGDGTPDNITRTHACLGNHTSRCPAAWNTAAPSWSQSFSYQLPEGRNEMTLAAYDILGQQSGLQTWTELIDRSGPEMSVSGSLVAAEASGDPLAPGEYELHIDATDGNAAAAATSRSGVTRTEILVDGVHLDEMTQACPAGNCTLSRDWTFDTTEYETGQHHIIVRATDQLGHTTVASLMPTIGGGSTDLLPCTGPQEPVNFDHYSLGPTFQDLPLVEVTRVCNAPIAGDTVRTNYVSYLYGDEVEIQSWPACERTLVDYEIEPGVPYPRTMLPEQQDVPTASLDEGLRVELYTGDETIVIFGRSTSQTLTAATSVRAEPAAQAPTTPSASASPSGDLPEPVAGAMEGALECE
jgi:hypothetical protein